MTFVFYEDASKPTMPFRDLQLAFIQNDSKTNLVRVIDSDLAKTLKLDHGKFYCYYKPSFANYDFEHVQRTHSFAENHEDVAKYPTVVDQLLNRRYMDEFALNVDFVEGEEF